MNCKVAKRLRKEAGYHPSQPRTYVGTNETRKYFHDKSGKRIDYTVQSQELHDGDPRSLYKELKKEYYASKRTS